MRSAARFSIEVLALGVAVVAGCNPPHLASSPAKAMPHGVETPIAAPSSSTAPRAPVAEPTEEPRSVRAGADISFERAFKSGACRVEASRVGKAAAAIPASVKASLESDPAALENHQKGIARYRLKNTGASEAVVYFHPSLEDPIGAGRTVPAHFGFHFTLRDPKTFYVHEIDAHELFDAPGSPPDLVALTLAAGGIATLDVNWCARRSVGADAPRTWVFDVPLKPGPYLLQVRTPEHALDVLRTPITVIAGGDRQSECTSIAPDERGPKRRHSTVKTRTNASGASSVAWRSLGGALESATQLPLPSVNTGPE